jgi:hypothetical protein
MCFSKERRFCPWLFAVFRMLTLRTFSKGKHNSTCTHAPPPPLQMPVSPMLLLKYRFCAHNARAPAAVFLYIDPSPFAPVRFFDLKKPRKCPLFSTQSTARREVNFLPLGRHARRPLKHPILVKLPLATSSTQKKQQPCSITLAFRKVRGHLRAPPTIHPHQSTSLAHG